MYIVGVPNLTIYLPADLIAGVRHYRISPSKVCQRALRAEVKRAEGVARLRAQQELGRTTNQQEAK